MRQKYSLSGSITLFYSLVLVLCISLVLALVEGARMRGLRIFANQQADVVSESVLTMYDDVLQEEYGIYGMNVSGEEGIVLSGFEEEAKSLAKINLQQDGEGFQLYRLALQAASIDEYQLITDRGGENFRNQITEYMKTQISKVVAKEIQDRTSASQQNQQTSQTAEERVRDANNSIQKAKEAEKEAAKQKSSNKQTHSAPSKKVSSEETENPLEYLAAWKDKGMLSLLGIDTEKVSSKSVDKSTCLDKRTLKEGNWSLQENGYTGDNAETWYQQVLLDEYVLEKFSNYQSTVQWSDSDALSYGVEYIIVGKDSDAENLKVVLEKILAIREAANFVYLQTDSEKKAASYSLALTLAGATANPIFIKAVEEGILAVWAFAEAISDVRTLVSGGAVPLVKTAASWKTDITALSKSSTFSETQSDKNGMKYEDYLRIILASISQQKLTMRTMDMIEKNIQKKHEQKGYASFTMDRLVVGFQLKLGVEGKAIFYSAFSSAQWIVYSTAGYSRKSEEQL